MPPNEIFGDLDDEEDEQLLGSLHLGPAEEEPVRRGAASRAASVRFDESALHGSSWGGGGHGSRHSGDFAPLRPGSGLMMERTLSHKSDGRHSSAGHSVHSHHSVASGRASSLGLDTNYPGDEDDDESFDIPGPPASFYVLGSVPSIVRCWLTTNYAHGTLLYADICTGAQKSTVDYSLIRELSLTDDIQRDVDGIQRIRLSVYFAEAIITQHSNRSSASEGAVPSITVLFDITGIEQPSADSIDHKSIRIFIGSDALRAHSADVLFSSNTMALFGDDRERLRVPFVRPEDDTVFKHISTCQVFPEKPKLNANAAPFIFSEPAAPLAGTDTEEVEEDLDPGRISEDFVSPKANQAEVVQTSHSNTASDNSAAKGEGSSKDATESEKDTDRGGSVASETSRKEASSGIWGSWRSGPNSGGDSASGYQPAARPGRGMKILKPQKSSSSSARTGSSYEPPPSLRGSSESRRRSQMGMGPDATANGAIRWDAKRAVSLGGEAKPQVLTPTPTQNQPQTSPREGRNMGGGTLPRSANPVGGASAFSWMTPPGKPPKTSAES